MARVRFVREGQEVAVPAGATLREAARQAGVRLHSGVGRALDCRGRGRCGECRVVVTEGADRLSPAGWREFRARRPRNERGCVKQGIDDRAGERLACQARVEGPVSVWTRLREGRPAAPSPAAEGALSLASRAGPIAVTGGTGFVGGYVLAELAARGLQARVLVRDDREEIAGFEAVRGDLRDPDSLPRLVDGASAVLHLAAIGGTADAELMDAVNLRGTRNLLDAARDAGVPRVVLLSSSAARRPAHGAYSAGKRGQEEMLRRSGIPFVILQPPMIYGDGSQVQRFLARLARLPVVPVIGGDAPLVPVHVADVAWACAEALVTDGIDGRTLPIGGPESVLFVDVARRILAAEGSAARPVALPRPVAMVAAFGLERVLARPLLTVEGVRAATAGTPVDNRAAAELLGYAPRRLQDGLRGSERYSNRKSVIT